MQRARSVAVVVTLAALTGPDAATALAELRAASPVAWVEPLGGWLVTSHDLATTVLRDAGTFTVDDPRFSTARVVGPSMLSLDGPAHHRHRVAFAAAFRPAQVADRFAAVSQGVATQLIDAVVRDGDTADLRTTVAGPLSVAVVAHALGLRGADASTVLRWYAAIVASVTAITAGQEPPTEATSAMGELAAAVAQHHPDSLLDTASRALTHDEVVSDAAVLMFGGIETTEAMICNALVHLLTHPDALAAVRRDPAKLAVAVEESLRLEPAAAVVDRYATAGVTLGGVSITRGDLVRVSLAGANRDPAVFDDPDRYDLDRPNLRAQLAFARGPHVCIAMDLARLETVTAVGAVLDRLPRIALAEPVAAQGLVFRKPPSVPVRW